MSRAYNPPARRALPAVAGLLAIALTGCASNDFSDLELYIDEVLSRPASPIQPPPEFKTYESVAYAAAELDDPFKPFYGKRPDTPVEAGKSGGVQPDTCGTGRRNCEELEQFPLDSLRMVGTLERADEQWGIVMSQDGSVYRVQVGNYLGQNFGKIMSISEERIDLREIVPDGLGGWQEREASLALSE